ncbi:MAG TPA: IucA/IucC family protein, partial [Stackebrandtia sp.]|uniref:IucA/IucC family protein n=1 Tax=Stackebrandtia sp. TaxID=2023065 RepID=UPI002D3EF1F8
LARTAARPHPAPAALWDTARRHHPDPSVYFEQLIIDGHPAHPLCRRRGDLADADVRELAPEHHPQVPIVLAPLDDAVVAGAWPWHAPDGRPLLPLHPLQAASHLELLTPTDATLRCAPLMSLRTLAPYTQPDIHLKTAVDLRLTSAIRHVSPAAIHNGPILSRLVANLGIPRLEVLTERGAVAALLPDSDPSAPDLTTRADPALAAIVRDSPARILADDHVALPLAALSEPDPVDGRPLVTRVVASAGIPPAQWWRECVTTLLPPLLRLLADHGIAAEAHGQNTLLALHQGRPAAAVYRDFGGVRVWPERLAASGVDCPPLHGDLACDGPETLHSKLISMLYAVALSQLVHAMSLGFDEAPETWWRTVADVSRTATADDGLRAALFAPTWPIKAYTVMRLSDRPIADQWTSVANPLARL